MTSIIDYDAGNIKSVENALSYIGEEAEVTRDPERILSSDHIILPGVGAFGDAMEKLRSYGLEPVIREAVSREIPFLGICLGLQLLFEESEESPGAKGLCLLPGKILKFPEMGLKIPHIGWNSVRKKAESDFFREVPEESYYYFVHSYYLPAENPAVAGETEYGIPFGAIVQKGKLFACQFHPEKSSTAGRRLLQNFLAL